MLSCSLKGEPERAPLQLAAAWRRAWRGQRGLNGAEGGLTLKGAWRGLQGGLKPSTLSFLYHPTFPFFSSWPAWAYCPARRSYFSLSPFSLFPSRSRSFFSIYLVPLLPPSPSASPLLRPYCLSRCLPKVARPNAPLAWCRLWSLAIIARCYYVPPTILVPPMLVDAVDHLVHYCLLALSLPSGCVFTITSFFFPLHCRTSARHCRSTTGISEERKQISPKAKANKNKHTNQTKQHPQKAKPGKNPGKFAS